MQVHSLSWGEPLDEGMETHTSILAGESHGQRSLDWWATVHRVTKSLTRLRQLRTAERSVYLKVAKRVNLKHSYTRKKIISRWNERY